MRRPMKQYTRNKKQYQNQRNRNSLTTQQLYDVLLSGRFWNGTAHNCGSEKHIWTQKSNKMELDLGSWEDSLSMSYVSKGYLLVGNMWVYRNAKSFIEFSFLHYI